jgi:peptide/nickel transport system substrate-binding protein
MASVTRGEFLRLSLGAAAAGLSGPILHPRRAAAAGKLGGTLTVGISSDIKTLDPQMSPLDVFRHTIRSTVFEALVYMNPDTLQADPMLAQSWQTAPDGRSVVFGLQRGVTWHDGTPFTAVDVVFSIKRVQDPKVGSPFSPQVAQVADVTALDPHTVRVDLKATTPGILADLSVIQMVCQKSIDRIARQPIGTGPFKFANWQPGDHIRVERFENYSVRGMPKVDAIEWRIVPDSQARLSALQDGSLLLLALVEGKDVKQARTFADTQVISTKPYVLYENLNINTRRPPFNDKRVRQAMAYAFDRNAYTKTVWFGLARPTINPVPPEMPTYLQGSSDEYPFDLKKAATLLNEAGFSAAKPLKMEILTPTGFDALKSMALLLQDNFNRIGHAVAVRDMEITVWIDRILNKPDYDVTTNNYNTVPEDPAGMFNSPNLAPNANVSLWNPPGYADLVARAQSEPNAARRTELYRQLQRLLLDEMPQITVDHLPLFFLANASVSGLVIGPSGIDDYRKVAIAS